MRDTSNTVKGIIIVEGADCTGKTTLTQLFRKKFKARYMHLRIHKKMEVWHTATVRRAIRKKANTLYVWCAPEDSAKVIRTHRKKKEERHEEYSDITRIVDRYKRSWYGLNYEHNNFLKSLGELRWRKNFIRYDVFKEGHKLDDKAYDVINRLRYLRGEAVWRV